MDQPQHQVFGTGRQSYRFMSYPPPKQPLQLLYPGRFMLNSYHYDGSNIPNENPVGLEETRDEMAAFTKASKMEQEALARHLGGKNKVARHPAVEPEAIMEDPALSSISLRDYGGLDPNLENVPSKYDHLREIDAINDVNVSRIREAEFRRGEAPMTEHNPNNILPRYDWSKKDKREYYNGENSGGNTSTYRDCTRSACTIYTCNDADNTCSQQLCDKNGKNCQDPSPCDYGTSCGSSHSSSDTSSYNKTVLWIALGVILIVAIVAIFIFIYGIHKHKAAADSLRPNNYVYLAPQYLPSDMNIGDF